MPNAIVLTTIREARRSGGAGSELLTAENIRACAPHDIEIRNCTFGYAEEPLRSRQAGGYGVDYPAREGEHMRVLLVKDAHSVRYRGCRFSGERAEITIVHFNSDGGGKGLSAQAARALHRASISGDVLDEPAPRITPVLTEVPFACGPG